jgi:hypothetical protein
MDKRNLKPWIIVGAAVLIAAVAYPHYFKWWDHRNCAQSGGTYSEAEGACIEPRGAKFATEESLHSGGDKPRE